jgi:hypothetical protein
VGWACGVSRNDVPAKSHEQRPAVQSSPTWAAGPCPSRVPRRFQKRTAPSRSSASPNYQRSQHRKSKDEASGSLARPAASAASFKSSLSKVPQLKLVSFCERLPAAALPIGRQRLVSAYFGNRRFTWMNPVGSPPIFLEPDLLRGWATSGLDEARREIRISKADRSGLRRHLFPPAPGRSALPSI